ncbi:MAG TPA: leucyl aminopeptidase family protein, partial [Aliiroseovarius sp.]|nr:leucyl aminopeptidase family protein [Aliiroseovarius sp.]
TLAFAPADTPSLPLHIIRKDGLAAFLATCTPAQKAWIEANDFRPSLGQLLVVPGADGTPAFALFGWGDKAARKRGRFHLARARAMLPEGTWHLACDLSGAALEEAALGWLLAGYHFDKYREQSVPKAQLKAPDGIDAKRLEVIAASEALTRDLINTPANDMGPAALESAARELAGTFAAEISVTEGAGLLEANLPMIHAVGRAADQAPRLIDLHWGKAGPRLTLVGKGVCFDTGGLNLKPGASMGLMKKDMGGAAAVLGLARMIMALDLPLRLRVLIPAVENSVSAGAMRPGDILTSRKGLTVEINNTDAEGRLVLADALALADEESPEMIVSMATLTGAARVAVGPDLAPFYATQKRLAEHLEKAGRKVRDPLWQLPFWEPYEAQIEPGIADLDNAPKGGFAGSITAALFLRRFVTQTRSYAHFDIYGWQPSAAPARPKGGVGQATRAVLAALPGVLKL